MSPKLIRAIQIASAVTVGIAVTAIIAGFVVDSRYSAKAVLAQRVERDATAGALFGQSDPDAFRSIGSPQLFVVDDQGAYLAKRGPAGEKLLDEDYLKAHHIYPLQLRTVTYVNSLVRLAFEIVLALSALSLALSWRSLKSQA